MALGHTPKVILCGRAVNDQMPYTIAREIIQHLISHDFSIKTARILILGATFKENVSDFRNSKIVDLVKELQSYYLNLEIHDPLVNKEAFHHEYNLTLTDQLEGTYDVVVLAVQHEVFAQYDESFFMKSINSNRLLYDIRGTFRDKVKHLAYLSL